MQKELLSKFRTKCRNVSLPDLKKNLKTIYRLRTTSTILNSNLRRRIQVLAAVKFEKIGARLDKTPTNFGRDLSITHVSVSSS